MNDKFGLNDGVLKTMNVAQPLLNLQKQLERNNQLEPLKISQLRNYQLADYQYEILMETIKEFENELGDNQEVAVQLAAFGQSIVMQVTGIGYSNPALIHFHGFVNGQKSQLIQHVEQLSFLLMAVPKDEPERPTRRIGFAALGDEASE